MTEIDCLREKCAREAKETLAPGLLSRQINMENEISQSRKRFMKELEDARERTILQGFLKSLRLARAWYQLKGMKRCLYASM